MQEGQRRSQRDRSDRMRAALLRAARTAFARDGFSATGTPEIAAAAGVTRGALYHHFLGKEALFTAVIQAEAEAIAAAIKDSGFAGLSPLETLIQGGEALLSAMTAPGRARLMLVEAPAVLGPEQLARIDAARGVRTLADGLAATGAANAGNLAALLSAAYDRAALAMDGGEPPGPWRAALERLVRGVAG